MKYGTYRDFRANKKEPLSDSLVINYNRFLLVFYQRLIFRCSMRNLLSDNLLWYIGTNGKRTLKK